MSLKKVDEVKVGRFFKLADLIIYGAIAAIVAALFIALFFTRDNGELLGIRIYVRYEAVFEYDFEKDKASVFDGCVDVADGETLVVTISVDGGYNVVRIDKSARSVTVVEADCRTHDCVRTPAIKDNNGIIFCSPHRVRIEPYGSDKDGTFVI